MPLWRGERALRESHPSRAFCPAATKTVCFHLKGGLVTIFPPPRRRHGVPGNFSLGPSPTRQADVADHFIKLLYYSSGPCGGPRCPFSETIFYRDICRRGSRASPRSLRPVPVSAFSFADSFSRPFATGEPPNLSFLNRRFWGPGNLC